MCGPDLRTPPSPPLTMASLLLDNQTSLLSRDDEKGVFLPSKLNGQGKNERNMTIGTPKSCVWETMSTGDSRVGVGDVSIIDNTGLSEIIIFFSFPLVISRASSDQHSKCCLFG